MTVTSEVVQHDKVNTGGGAWHRACALRVHPGLVQVLAVPFGKHVSSSFLELSSRYVAASAFAEKNQWPSLWIPLPKGTSRRRRTAFVCPKPAMMDAILASVRKAVHEEVEASLASRANPPGVTDQPGSSGSPATTGESVEWHSGLVVEPARLAP